MTRSAGGPVTGSDRITNLDTVRGVATLGILVMNVVSFGLIDAGYFNVDAEGSETWYDRMVGLLGEVFVDQKTMALFSLLFGVGIVVFADRAAAKGRRPVWLSLWRNLLLLGIGLLHTLLWEGDILTVYAVCAPILLLARKWSARTLFVLGGAIMALAAVWAMLAQVAINGSDAGAVVELGSFWTVGADDMSDTVGLFFLADFFLRALGMMLIGVGLFRSEIVQGQRPADFYRSMARWSLGIGIPLAVAATVLQVVNDWDAETALLGAGINTFATAPVALGYLALITLWNQRRSTAVHERIRAVGRMALTNYLTQTIFGIVVLRNVFEQGEFGRATLFGFVVVVWVIQIAWSKPWLDRFRFGPFEWVWRMLTYVRFEPLRKATA
ncbi:MAG: DUF418 domain-containing protein [Actinomycetota bacterium]